MPRTALILSCVIHGGILAVVGWSALVVAPRPEQPGTSMRVSLLPNENTLVLEDTGASEGAAVPVEINFTPPPPTIPLAPAPAMESPPAPIQSISSTSDKSLLAPAKKERAPQSGRVAGRVGASNNADSTGYVPPRFLLRYKPPYPTPARAQRLEGVVLLLVAVDAEGRVTSATIRRSCGHLVLDRAALESVRSWRFNPARQADHAVPAVVEVPIRFAFSALGGN